MAVDGSGIWHTLLLSIQYSHISQNPITRDEIQALWDEHRYEELDKRMRYSIPEYLLKRFSELCSRRIGFGTAGLPYFLCSIWPEPRSFNSGLRGKMEAGWNRMNGRLF